jgi:antitoxin (DNA-binding transcriptional repressor) of toxin-antitoxin stability system
MGRITRIEDSPELLSLVEDLAPGEDMVITRNGEEIGRIAGPKRPDQAEINAAVARWREARKGVTLGGLSWKELRDEGRP